MVSGDPLVECVSIAESCKKVVAVGINCTPPRFIHDLILAIRKVFLLRFYSSAYNTNHLVELLFCFLIMFS